jgi:hippurate hydrolase
VKVYTRELLEGIAASFGLTVEIEFDSATKVLMNDPAAIERLERVVGQMLGAGRYQDMPTPIAGGEDFASVLAEVPGAFVFLGACPREISLENAATNHSNKAQFDDSVLADGAALLASLAIDTLNG